jgi:hypothetical protein
MSDARAGEVALAVNEIASNALLHGSPPATLRIWSTPGKMICEVTDVGGGITDPLAGQLTPSVHGIGGRGIWLARMLCDAVEIRNGTGCTVSLHVSADDVEAGASDRSKQGGVHLGERGGPAQGHGQVEFREHRPEHHFNPLLPIQR